MRKVAMVAALEREVKPLIRIWRRTDREYQGCHFRFFENDSTVVVCGGIGEQAARRATEAVIALFSPEVIYSVGFAGASCRYRACGTCIGMHEETRPDSARWKRTLHDEFQE